MYPVFAPLQSLCDAIEPDEPPPDPIFRIYEELSGFDYRVCARRYVDPRLEGTLYMKKIRPFCGSFAGMPGACANGAFIYFPRLDGAAMIFSVRVA